MKIHVKFNIHSICTNLIANKLDALDVKYKLDGFGEIEILQPLSQKSQKQLLDALNTPEIEVVNDLQMIVVQKLKTIISEMVKQDGIDSKIKVSKYLENKLPYSYTYMSRLFSEVTNMSIEKFVILKKIDYVKNLLMENNVSLTQIAHKLNYSSVSHLSKQFKNTTGFSPSDFVNLKKQLRGIN